MFPRADLNDPVAAREKLAELSAKAPAPDIQGMKIEDRMVPATPNVPVRIYRPHVAQGGIVWLHGGGFVMGGLDVEHPWAARIARASGTVVVSVGYRLAPEHRFPAALDDAYAAAMWTAEHATELGVDRNTSPSAVTRPARGSRPRWLCARVINGGQQSAFNCSISPSSTIGKRPGRRGASPIRHS
jgi:hypothetical protein